MDEQREQTKRKAIKSGRLAMSAERIGSESEAITAAMTAGRLAWSAGMTMGELHAELGTMHGAEMSWSYMVDGWYDASEAAA